MVYIYIYKKNTTSKTLEGKQKPLMTLVPGAILFKSQNYVRLEEFYFVSGWYSNIIHLNTTLYII